MNKGDEGKNFVQSLFRFDSGSFGGFNRQFGFPTLTLAPLSSSFHLYASSLPAYSNMAVVFRTIKFASARLK